MGGALDTAKARARTERGVVVSDLIGRGVQILARLGAQFEVPAAPGSLFVEKAQSSRACIKAQTHVATSHTSQAHQARAPPHPHTPPTMAKERIVTCEECGTASTPLWRKDDRNRNLCNACGIRWKRSLTSKSKKNLAVAATTGSIFKQRPHHEAKKSFKISTSPLSAKSWPSRQYLQAFDAFEQLIAAAESEYEQDVLATGDHTAVSSPVPELLVPASPAPASAYASSAEEEAVASDNELHGHLSSPLPALPSVLLQRAYPSFLTA